MNQQYEKYKGIHPGILLDRELKKRSIKQRPFALLIGEHPQTFNAITKGKRNFTPAITLRIEKELDLEEGTLLILQAYYQIKIEKEKVTENKPDFSILRKSLFWDTAIEKIDWEQHYKAIINRVMERGNEAERNEITRFYGKAKIEAALKAPKTKQSSLQVSIQ